MRSRALRQTNKEFIRQSRNTNFDKRPKPAKKKKAKKNTKRKKTNKGKAKHSRLFSNLRDIGLSIGLVLFIVGTISYFLLGFANVKGYGMSSTLKSNDLVIYRKTSKIKRFDLIVFNRGGKKQVRRVIGLPDEDIKYIDDTLYVDGKPVDEKFIVDEINEVQKNGGQYTEDFSINSMIKITTIPKGRYLLLGDNRPYSTDSRDYGLVDEKDILGVVKLRILPIDGLEAF